MWCSFVYFCRVRGENLSQVMIPTKKQIATVTVWKDSSYDINKYLTMGYFGLVQSMAVSADTYTYVPDTVCDMPSLHDGNELKLTKDLWRSEQKAPYRYYQFSDSELDKGVCLAYDRSIGLGQNDIILMLDTHKSVTKDLTLPKYMDNMKTEVLDKSSNVVFEQACVRECKLRLSTPDYGYLVLKLYKCH